MKLKNKKNYSNINTMITTTENKKIKNNKSKKLYLK